MINKIFIKKRDKAGQYYLIVTIILVGLVIGFAVIMNSSSKNDPVKIRETAKELKIESEKVLDYDLVNSENKFEEFSRDYSAYIEGNEIYFILVEENDFEAYKYEGANKIDLTNSLEVGENIVFNLEGVDYEFEKEEGKNLYFIITQEAGGEKYVFSN